MMLPAFFISWQHCCVTHLYGWFNIEQIATRCSNRLLYSEKVVCKVYK